MDEISLLLLDPIIVAIEFRCFVYSNGIKNAQEQALIGWLVGFVLKMVWKQTQSEKKKRKKKKKINTKKSKQPAERTIQPWRSLFDYFTILDKDFLLNKRMKINI